MKKLLYFVLIALTGILQAQISNTSLIAQYPFNGNGNDVSGNNFHGTLTGTSTYGPDRFGIPDRAINFNGIDSYYLISNVNSTFKPTTFPVTISAWVKLPTESVKLFHVFKNDFAQDIYSGIRVTVLPNGVVTCNIEDGGPIGIQSRRSKTGITNIKDNKWHHITCIIRGATDMAIFIDCKNDGGFYSGSGGTISYGSERPGIIGAIDGLLNNNFILDYSLGFLDDLRFYKRELTVDEICTLSSPPISCSVSITPSGPLEFCQGGSVTLTASGASNYTWSTGETGLSISVSNTTNNITVTGTSDNGCEAASNAVSVLSKLLPAVQLTAGGSPYFCPGGSVVFTANTGPNTPGTIANYQYLWSPGNEETQEIIATQAGPYFVTVTGANGCSKKSNTLNVYILEKPTIAASADVNIYPGGSTQLSATGGISYSWSPAASVNPATGSPVIASPQSTTTYTVTGKNQAGCEGTDEVKVTVLDPVHASFSGLNETYCINAPSSTLIGTPSGGTFSGPGVSGNTFNPATAGTGEKTITYLVQLTGGTAVSTSRNTLIKPTSAATFERSVCEGESVSYGGESFSTQGVHKVTVTGKNGCDSVITVYLKITPKSTNTIKRVICSGESVSYGGQTFDKSGIYPIETHNATPCQKTVLDLTVLPNKSSEYNKVICQGQQVVYGDQTFYQNGTFTIHVKATNGCDSTITLHLTVLTGETSHVYAEICAGETYTLPNGEEVSTPGEYPVKVNATTVSNCGNTIITHLKVNPKYTKNVDASIAEGSSYELPDGSFVNTADVYTTHLKSAKGCDSTIVTTLTVIVTPPAGGCYAVLVKGFKQGKMKNGNQVPFTRSNADNALYGPEPVVNGVINFVSLGFGGEITLAFDGPVANGPGNDIRVSEATWNRQSCSSYPELAEVFASQNGCDWIYIGKVCTNGGDLDLGPFTWAQYIKVRDISKASFAGFPSDADGFDVNAVECLNGPGTIANDGLIAGSIQDVIAYTPGNMKNGGLLPLARRNAANATGLPGGSGVNFVSLGFAGTLIGRFDYVVFNFSGPDLKVLETSYGNPTCTNYPEYAHFYGSKDGSDWTDLGTFCQDVNLDLGSLEWLQYIKVVDESLILSGKFSGSADGYDLDGVATIQPCESSKFDLELNDNVSEADEAYLLAVYPNPVVDHFNVQLEGIESNQQVIVQLTDAAGRLIFEKQYTTRGNVFSQTLQVEDLPHGIYHLSIRSMGGIWVEKLVK